MVLPRRLSPLAFVLLVGCGGSGGSSSPKPVTVAPKVTIAWPERTRTLVAPGEADVAELTLYDAKGVGKNSTYSAGRPSGAAAQTQTYTWGESVRPGSYLLGVTYRRATSLTVASARAQVTLAADGTILGADGQPLGPIALDRVVASIAILPNQGLEIGGHRDLDIQGRTQNGFLTPLVYGAARFEVVSGGENLRVEGDGSVTGVAEGDATVVMTLDDLRSEPMRVHVYGAPITVHSIELENLGFAADPVRNRLYASVYRRDRVVPIDPVAGTIYDAFEVGPAPTVVAVSDDASTLYTGLSAYYAVTSVDLATGTVGGRSAVVPGANAIPSDIAFAPGSHSTVAVCPGVGIFDNGVRRPNAASRFADHLVWTAPNRIAAAYGTNLQDIAVDDQGATLVRTVNDGTTLLGALSYANGRIYTSSGSVYDATTFTKVGQFDLSSYAFGRASASGPVIDVAANRAYFVESHETGAVRLHTFRLDTLETVADRRLAGSIGYAGMGDPDLVRWGAKGLAFRSFERIVLIDDASGL